MPNETDTERDQPGVNYSVLLRKYKHSRIEMDSKILQPEILSVDELTVLLRQVVCFVSVVLVYVHFGHGHVGPLPLSRSGSGSGSLVSMAPKPGASH